MKKTLAQSAAVLPAVQFAPEPLDANLTCAVCLEDLVPAFSYAKCQHKICGRCATQPQTKDQCPICRKKSAPRPDHTMTAVVVREQSLRKHRCVTCEELVSTEAMTSHQCDTRSEEERRRTDFFSDIAHQAGLGQKALAALVRTAIESSIGDDELLTMILSEVKLSEVKPKVSDTSSCVLGALPLSPSRVMQSGPGILGAASGAVAAAQPDAMTYVDLDQFAASYATDDVELFLSALMKKIVKEGLAPTVANIQLFAFGVPLSFCDEQMVRMLQAMQVQMRQVTSPKKQQETAEGIERDVSENAARVVVLVSSDQDFNYLARKMTREGKHFVVVHNAAAGSMHENRVSLYAAAAWRQDEILPGFSCKPAPDKAAQLAAAQQTSLQATPLARGLLTGTTAASDETPSVQHRDQPEVPELQVSDVVASGSQNSAAERQTTSSIEAGSSSAQPQAATTPTHRKKDSNSLVMTYMQQFENARSGNQIPPQSAQSSEPPVPAAVLPPTSSAVDALRTRGNAYFCNQQYAEAVSCYSDGIHLLEGRDDAARDKATLLSNRALCFSKLGQQKEALRDSVRARTVDPTFAKGYLRSAKILIDMGKGDQAIDVLLAAPDESGATAACDEAGEMQVRNEIVTLLYVENSRRMTQEMSRKPQNALVLCRPLPALLYQQGALGKEIAQALTVILQTPTRFETTKLDLLQGSSSWEARFKVRGLGKHLHVDFDVVRRNLPQKAVVPLNMLEQLEHFDKPLYDRFIATRPCARCGARCTKAIKCPVCHKLEFCSMSCLLQSVWWHVPECRVAGSMPKRNDNCRHGGPPAITTPLLIRFLALLEPQADSSVAKFAAAALSFARANAADRVSRVFSRVMLSCGVDAFIDGNFMTAEQYFMTGLLLQKEIPSEEPTYLSWGIDYETLVSWMAVENHAVLGYMMHLLVPGCGCMTVGLAPILAAARCHE